MAKMRKESDSLGTVEVPSDRYWGAQTQRSIENFPIGKEKMPIELIHALGVVKKAAAAIVNHELKLFPNGFYKKAQEFYSIIKVGIVESFSLLAFVFTLLLI